MMEKNVFLHYKALIAAMAVLHLFKHLYNKFVFLFKKKKTSSQQNNNTICDNKLLIEVK